MIVLYVLLGFFVFSQIIMAFDGSTFKDFLKGFFSLQGLKTRIVRVYNYFWKITDFIVCVMFGGMLEYISSFLYIKTTFRKHTKAWTYFRKFVDWGASLLGDKDHCKNSFYGERQLKDKSPEMRMTDEQLTELEAKYSD